MEVKVERVEEKKTERQVRNGNRQNKKKRLIKIEYEKKGVITGK